MMSLWKFFFAFGVLAVSLRNVLAVSSEEKEKFHADTTPYILECSAELGITLDDIKKVEKTHSYSTLDPCMMACAYKKCNVINDQGLYDAVVAEQFLKKYFSVEADQKKAIGIISNCKSVNEHEVTDGKKGCDRAKDLLACFSPLTAMFAKDN